MQYFVSHWIEHLAHHDGKNASDGDGCVRVHAVRHFFRQLAFCQTCSMNPFTMVLINSTASSDLPGHLHATCSTGELAEPVLSDCRGNCSLEVEGSS